MDLPDNISQLDVALDMRLDAGGMDMDSHSATLHRYHQLLWSKPLPNGQPFDLDGSGKGGYLVTPTGLELRSDQAINTMTTWERTQAVVQGFPESELEAFRAKAATIAASILWPGVNGRGGHTINQSRGVKPEISDRMDLTVECVRRHYRAEESPLDGTLSRYADFFELFVDFDTWVSWWLLDDLVDEYGGVRFFLPFSGTFGAEPAWPWDGESYGRYRDAAVSFIDARADRIAGTIR